VIHCLRKTPKPEDLFPLSFDPEETFQMKVDKAVVTPKKAKILSKMKKRKSTQKKKMRRRIREKSSFFPFESRIR
jgi:hypothetical protein